MNLEGHTGLRRRARRSSKRRADEKRAGEQASVGSEVPGERKKARTEMLVARVSGERLCHSRAGLWHRCPGDRT